MIEKPNGGKSKIRIPTDSLTETEITEAEDAIINNVLASVFSIKIGFTAQDKVCKSTSRIENLDVFVNSNGDLFCLLTLQKFCVTQYSLKIEVCTQIDFKKKKVKLF